MKNKYDTAIIFKKKVDKDGNIEFIPVRIVYGEYDEKEKVFVDYEGTSYLHILGNPDNYGYGYRNYVETYKNKYPLLCNDLLMKIVFLMIKKYKFSYDIEPDTKTPLIIMVNKNGKTEGNVIMDEDMKNIYNERYPLFIKKCFGEDNRDVSEKEDINIDKVYTELTNRIIDQEKPISEILTPIWKQCSNIQNNKSRSILVEGNTAVGKTEIFRYLSQVLNVPCFMATVDYTSPLYNGKCIEGMLFELLKITNFDADKASRGIIIIDKIEKINEVNYQTNIINDLLKILDGDSFKLNLNIGDYVIDTRKLMVICLINPYENKMLYTRKIGYERNNRQEDKHYEELISKFSTVVKMNELNYDSYIKILKSKTGTLNINKRLLQDNGVLLRIKTGTMKEISDKAITAKYGVRSLDEIIETALSVASFEIASNPNIYSELIISPDTIRDNKKYTLVKKKK